MPIKKIDDEYSLFLETQIRDKDSSLDTIRDSLYKLGLFIGSKVSTDFLLTETEVTTPLNELYKGLMPQNKVNLIYTTKSDYEYFGKGMLSSMPNTYLGYLDFEGSRGKEALHKTIRQAIHPELPKGCNVNTVVIAKAVLATGCTAISLLRNIISKYYPKNVIISSIFYSDQGIREIFSEFPNIDSIYIVGHSDNLNQEGMLVPGIGDLDFRIIEKN